MNKGLEALDRLFNSNLNNYEYRKDYDVIEKELKELELLKSNQIFIERAKKLKALEIIKDKRVNVDRLLNCNTAFQYNLIFSKKEKHLTQEEFGHLIEVFGND